MPRFALRRLACLSLVALAAGCGEGEGEGAPAAQVRDPGPCGDLPGWGLDLGPADACWTTLARDDGCGLALVASFQGEGNLCYRSASIGLLGSTFIHKLDRAGAPLWTKSFALDAPMSAMNGAGEMIVLGTNPGEVDLGYGAVLAGEGIVAIRLDASGSVLWGKRIPFTWGDFSGDVAIDDEGDILLLSGVHVEKLSREGAVLFESDIEGVRFRDVFTSSIETSADGTIFVAGSARADFDCNIVGCSPETSLSSIFFARMTSDGELSSLWQTESGSPLFSSFAVSNEGRAFLAYHLDLFQYGEHQLVAFDERGEPLWEQARPGSLPRLAIDREGSAYAYGVLDEPLDFGLGMLSPVGHPDLYLTKLNRAGDAVASKRFEAISARPMGLPQKSVIVDDAGHVFLAGSFLGAVAHDTGVLLSSSPQDTFVARVSLPAGLSERGGAAPVCGSGAAPTFALPQISAGGDHTCARLPTGEVKCWGGNFQNEIGSFADFSQTVEPVLIPSLPPAQRVDVGSRGNCATFVDQTVSCWGDNTEGSLSQLIPKKRIGEPICTGSARVTGVSLGTISCLLFDDGTVSSWSGFDDFSAVDASSLTGITQVTSGQTHACALAGDGTVFCWGANGGGQLGTGDLTQRDLPTQVAGLASIKRVAAGQEFTCALSTVGAVQCWGTNEYGQLGDGTAVDRYEPAPVKGLAGAVDIAVGASHACALLEDGTLRCWGRNLSGELGTGSTKDKTEPSPVVGLDGVVQMALGRSFSCVVRSDGGVFCWGANISGQAGSSTSDVKVKNPLRVPL